GKIHEALEVHLAHVDLVRKLDEGGKLCDRLFEAGEPKRDARFIGVKRALQRAKFADVPNDPRERVLAAHLLEGLWLGGIERHAQFVETTGDKVAAAPLVEQGAISIKKN